jgi:hypothetical protein
MTYFETLKHYKFIHLGYILLIILILFSNTNLIYSIVISLVILIVGISNFKYDKKFAEHIKKIERTLNENT